MDQEFSIGETENARALLLRGEILREGRNNRVRELRDVTVLERGRGVNAFLQLWNGRRELPTGRRGSAPNLAEIWCGKHFTFRVAGLESLHG